MEPEIGIGYRELRKGEKIPANHEFWAWGIGPWANCPERTGGIYANSDRLCRVPYTKSTQKPKEPKTMTTTKKPGTSHGKPTAKGMKVEKKPATVKPKYPAAREAVTYGVTITGKTTKESMKGMLDLTIEIHNGTLKDLASTGTKLDRALVDLKEAKAKIKALSQELTKGTEAGK